MSSISAGSRPGARSMAAWMAVTARVSGRTVRSEPRGALPTGVRTAETITASFIGLLLRAPLIAQGFAGGEHGLQPLHRLGRAADREERLALQVEQVLLVD